MKPPGSGTSPPRPPRTARAGAWPLFRSLRVHLALLLAGLFLVLYLLSSVLIYGLTARLTQDDVDALLRDTTRPLASRVLADLDRGVFPSQFVTLAKLSEMYPKVSAIVLRDAQGNVIASTAPEVTKALPYQYAGAASHFATDHVADRGWYRVLTLRLENPYHQPIAYLQMALNVDRERTAIASLQEVLYLVGVLGILFAAAAGYLLSRVSLRPAVRAWEQQEQFVADASHELRTPLTVMRVDLDVLESHPHETVAENADWLKSIGEEIQRMQRLSEQLLALARTRAPGGGPRHAPVDLAVLVGRAVEAFRPAAEAKGLALRGPAAPAGEEAKEVVVLGDADALYQLVAILLDNAVKYTPAGGIDVALGRQGREARLSVRDTGIGIEPEHLPRVFDRFYRTDAARAKGSGGTGLGLAIARDIALAHRGRISAESAGGQGTTFVVLLPLVARAGPTP